MTVTSVYFSPVTIELSSLLYPPVPIARYTLYPTMPAEVLAVQLSSTECVVAAMPSPLTAMVAGEFVALLATFTLPLTVPAVFGANVTFNVVL